MPSDSTGSVERRRSWRGRSRGQSIPKGKSLIWFRRLGWRGRAIPQGKSLILFPQPGG